MSPGTLVGVPVTDADPYLVFQDLAADIPGAADLSPDDAQTRAMYGCHLKWEPGTIDAALADAYAVDIERWTRQGLC